MDIGCRFYTPNRISEDIAKHAGKQNVIVDLFAGGGSLYKAFLRENLAQQAFALDINPLTLLDYRPNGKVVHEVVNCLNPNNINEVVPVDETKKVLFTLNPPFKRISHSNELAFWKEFKNYKPKYLTQRIECIAIAAAIQAAPKGSKIYAIIPQIVLDSTFTASFFNSLKINYAMEVVKSYKRIKFSAAEVDVSVISIKKLCDKCITSILKQPSGGVDQSYDSTRVKTTNNGVKIFRGKVRPPDLRDCQTSARHLKTGGADIYGILSIEELRHLDIKNYSIAGDILVARVGQRMLGRVGSVVRNCVITNESLYTLRIENKNLQNRIYQSLLSHTFREWCASVARGTANYFLSVQDIRLWIEQELEHWV